MSRSLLPNLLLLSEKINKCCATQYHTRFPFLPAQAQTAQPANHPVFCPPRGLDFNAATTATINQIKASFVVRVVWWPAAAAAADTEKGRHRLDATDRPTADRDSDSPNVNNHNMQLKCAHI
jgi:hypothetical protein